MPRHLALLWWQNAFEHFIINISFSLAEKIWTCTTYDVVLRHYYEHMTNLGTCNTKHNKIKSLPFQRLLNIFIFSTICILFSNELNLNLIISKLFFQDLASTSNLIWEVGLTSIFYPFTILFYSTILELSILMYIENDTYIPECT